MAVTEVVRLLHPSHFSERKNRYTSLAFRPSGGGVSVINTGCIAEKGRTICAHAEQYYSRRIRGSPTIFWRIGTAELAPGHELVQQTTDTGDECHYNIVGMSEQQCRELLHSKQVTDFEICDPNGSRKVTAEDLPPLP